jgi:hypothetical protein
MKITKKVIYLSDEGFEFTFEPIEDTLKIVKTKTGFEAKYLIQDNDPIDPREYENLGKMVCFHKLYTLGDKTDLNSDMFSGWEELYDHLKKVKKAIIILSLYLYDHSGISMKVGSFQGYLPQGHAEFDSGQVGFIYCTEKDLKRIGITKARAEKSLMAEVEVYNQYLQGDIYCCVKETYNKDKEQIDYDTRGNYFGYSEAVKELENAF